MFVDYSGVFGVHGERDTGGTVQLHVKPVLTNSRQICDRKSSCRNIWQQRTCDVSTDYFICPCSIGANNSLNIFLT